MPNTQTKQLQNDSFLANYAGPFLAHAFSRIGRSARFSRTLTMQKSCV